MNLNKIFGYLLVLSCFPALTACSKEPVVYKCLNSGIESRTVSSPPQFRDGWGTVYVEIESNSSRSTVNYDNRYLIHGNLEMDQDVYITDEIDSQDSYPQTTNRLRINRYSGAGYFQSSRYMDAHTLPDYKTERLESCEVTQKRF